MALTDPTLMLKLEDAIHEVLCLAHELEREFLSDNDSKLSPSEIDPVGKTRAIALMDHLIAGMEHHKQILRNNLVPVHLLFPTGRDKGIKDDFWGVDRFRQYKCVQPSRYGHDFADAFEIRERDKCHLTAGVGPGDYFVMYPTGEIAIVAKHVFEFDYRLVDKDAKA